MADALEDVKQTADAYRRKCKISSRGHFLASDELRRRHLFLGLPALAASIIVGTTIFGTLQSNPNMQLKVLAGLVSMAAALLSGFQTFFDFSERSEKHRASGAMYSAVRRELETYLLKLAGMQESQRTEAIACLEKVTSQLNKLAQECPALPDRHWEKAYIEADNERLPAKGNSKSGVSV